MANNFADDARIIEFWRFENNLLAGKAGNDLTQYAAPTYNSVSPLEGSYSLDLEASSFQYAYRLDSDLSAGFPLKNGDTVKKISVAFWITPESVSTLGFMLAKYETTGRRTFAVAKNSAALAVFNGYNNGASAETWEVISSLFVAGRNYHIGVAVDGVNKNALVRVWDAYNATATTYTHNFTNEMSVKDGTFQIGKINTGNWYDGLIDEVVVANDLLSADEFDLIRQGLFGVAIWKKLAYSDDVIAKSLFDAQSVIAAVSDNTPAVLTVSEQRLLGRKTGGNIAALTPAEALTILGAAPAADWLVNQVF